MSAEQVAGYRLDEVVGRGATGVVYRAYDARLDRAVALKILDPRHRGERILRESRLAASLDHPNVIPVYEAGAVGDDVYIAMRYVDGVTLQRLLREEGPLAPERTIRIAAQAAAALDAAHARGLVHRDVKPSNCLLDLDEHLYLADFGLTVDADAHDAGVDGSELGTIDYVAPEQIRGDAVDGRADEYALGCMLFECLTGAPPFGRASEVATLFAHLEAEPPPASERRPGLAPAVDPVLARALAKEPGDRFATCGELVAAAAAALDVPAAPRRRRVVAGLALGAVAAVAALLAALLLRGGDGAQAAPTGTLVRIDPVHASVARRWNVSTHPAALTTAAGRVWLGDFREGALYRLEPSTGDMTRVPSEGEPRALAGLGDSVYVGSDSTTATTGIVTRYDAATGIRSGQMNVATCSIAAGEGVVWATACPFVDRVSTDGGPLRMLRVVPLPFPVPRTGETDRTTLQDAAVGHGAVWVLGDMVDRRVWRLDPRSGRILATIPLPFAPGAIASGPSGVWITGPIDDVVARIDPATDRVGAPIRVGRGAGGVAVGGDDVWVANALDGTVSRVDPAGGRVVDTVAVGGQPREVAIGAGGVWVTADAP